MNNKLVIYRTFFYGYCVTSEDNYSAAIQDAAKIQKCTGFKSANEIINYYCRYCKRSPKDFIVIDN